MTYRLTTRMDPDKARWVGSGIPPNLRGLNFNDVEELGAQRDALKKARFYIEGLRAQQSKNWRGDVRSRFVFGRGLLFAGAPGTGKTTLAAAVLTEARIRWGFGVYMTRYPEYINKRREYVSGQITEPEAQSAAHWMLDRTQHSQLLVLDDVGHEHSSLSKFAEDTLESVLRTRYSDGNPTIITTNLTAEEWEARYTKPLRSFMDQATRRTIFLGESLRDPE